MSRNKLNYYKISSVNTLLSSTVILVAALAQLRRYCWGRSTTQQEQQPQSQLQLAMLSCTPVDEIQSEKQIWLTVIRESEREREALLPNSFISLELSFPGLSDIGGISILGYSRCVLPESSFRSSTDWKTEQFDSTSNELSLNKGYLDIFR